MGRHSITVGRSPAGKIRATARAAAGTRPRHRGRALALACAIGGLAFFPAGASPASDPETGNVCEQWAAVAAEEHGVPHDLMRAIARVESGRQSDGTVRPWPWAVNIGGKGHWLPHPEAARALAVSALRRGETQIDLGCFQLNLNWHGRAFASLDDMLDPARNARYAARFLAALHREFGDWTRATGAYHSRTPGLARAYVARIAAALEPGAPLHTTSQGADRSTLRSRGPQPLIPRAPAASQPALGSLVPLGAALLHAPGSTLAPGLTGDARP